MENAQVASQDRPETAKSRYGKSTRIKSHRHAEGKHACGNATVRHCRFRQN
jgi:hypothetical protein